MECAGAAPSTELPAQVGTACPQTPQVCLVWCPPDCHRAEPECEQQEINEFSSSDKAVDDSTPRLSAGAAGMNLTVQDTGLPSALSPSQGCIQNHHCTLNREYNTREQELLWYLTERTALQALENI